MKFIFKKLSMNFYRSVSGLVFFDAKFYVKSLGGTIGQVIEYGASRIFW